MTDEQVATYIADRQAAGVVPTVRIKVPAGAIYKWHDIVKVISNLKVKILAETG